MSKVFFWSLLQITCHKARTLGIYSEGEFLHGLSKLSQKNWDHIGFKQDTHTKPHLSFFTIFPFWGGGVGRHFNQEKWTKCVDLFIAWVSLPVLQFRYGTGYGMVPLAFNLQSSKPSVGSPPATLRKRTSCPFSLSRPASASRFNKSCSWWVALRGDPWKRNLLHRAEVLGVSGLCLQTQEWGMDRGGHKKKKKKKVNSASPQILSELLMSKSAEHFLLKIQK